MALRLKVSVKVVMVCRCWGALCEKKASSVGSARVCESFMPVLAG